MDPLKKLKRLYHRLSHYGQMLKLFKGLGEATFAGGNRPVKSRFTIVLDYLYLFFVLKVAPFNYYLFQFDAKHRSQFREYLGEITPALLDRFYEALWDDRYSSLINDKYVFSCLCESQGLPAARVFGIFRNGRLLSGGEDLVKLMTAHNVEEVVMKPVRGVQGRDICFISKNKGSRFSRDSLSQLSALKKNPDMKDVDFIVQERIEQHPVLKKINPYCLNTVRIITLLTPENESEVLAAMLRTSSDRSPTDNFTTGGIVVGIDLARGRLMDRGFIKYPKGRTITRHPLTDEEFRDLEIPHWDKLLDVVNRAQKTFRQLKSIGWDVAITEGGPVLIEGNIEWGTVGIQAASGGLLSPINRQLFARYGLRFYE